MKNLISAEVQRQIALENPKLRPAEGRRRDPASSGIQRMLTRQRSARLYSRQGPRRGGHRRNGMRRQRRRRAALTNRPRPMQMRPTLACSPARAARNARKGDNVSVALADLQDMQNHMRETIGAGWVNCKPNKARVASRASAIRQRAAPEKTDIGLMRRRRIPTASTQINQQWGEADKAEQRSSGPSRDGCGPGPCAYRGARRTSANIALGQTIDQVTGAARTAQKRRRSRPQENLRVPGHEDHVQRR